MEREAEPEPVIELDEVTAELGGRTVLRGVSLTVGRGEVVALLGANGSGKSTAVRAVVGQVPVTGGGLRLFGHPVRSFGAWARIGYVPQRSTAAGGVPATVREVVAAGRLARRRLRPLRRADRAAVDRAIERVGLAERASEPVDALSGGQHQRVLIARALTAEPELLIMDEPLAGVDLDSQRVLAETLRTQVEGGASVLLVLHELGPLAPLIDRAVVLGHGRVERTVDRPARLPEGSHPCHPADELEPSAEPTLQTGVL
ncbi:ATP-binding cassette domain-containing protein [Streptomyces sp. 3MP-14]|uniref:ATP-binding cassette domain-containing protein n=1 Tax=Streptomyces mimosae TaxID=2586635 RepID=A0A5N6ANX8_9ACTN|nr:MULTISPECIES: ATP-binding cassette domain-containing protein [Streptomyces]KAB8169822.1 ATP-binding cassette domain-containing protein [Streptomyces mimosae]KAB8178570.1 ATP-binding cassette domain-containing protein [Streptomyces sp. 3MP-14]